MPPNTVSIEKGLRWDLLSSIQVPATTTVETLACIKTWQILNHDVCYISFQMKLISLKKTCTILNFNSAPVRLKQISCSSAVSMCCSRWGFPNTTHRQVDIFIYLQKMDQAFSNLASVCPFLASGAHPGDKKLSRAEGTMLQTKSNRKEIRNRNKLVS